MFDFLKVYFVKNQFYLIISVWGVTDYNNNNNNNNNNNIKIK